jgi:hypothetical protein
MEALMKLNEIKRMLTENNLFVFKVGLSKVSFFINFFIKKACVIQ